MTRASVLALSPCCHVLADAGHTDCISVRASQHLRSLVHPADRTIRAEHAELDIVVDALLDAALIGRGTHLPVVGMNRFDHLGIGERKCTIPAVVLLGDAGGGQIVGPEVVLPDAQSSSFGREVQPRRVFLLDVQPVRHLGHQGRVVAFESLKLLALKRDVDLTCEEVGDVTLGIAHRRHKETVPERLACLAIVKNINLDRLALVDRRPQEPHRVGIGFRPL